MDIKLLSLYFLVGGTVIALVTYFGSQAKSLLAAFVAVFPAITVITVCTIYFSGGVNAATSYFKGILFMAPAWLLYLFSVLYLLPRLGFVPSLVIGVFLYLTTAFAIMKLVPWMVRML
jgi:uncharacterized membrane protein (GlpM family)